MAASLLAAAGLTQPAFAEVRSAPRSWHGTATAGQLFKLAEDYARRGSTSDAEAILAVLSDDPDADVRNEARFRRAKLLQARRKLSQAAALLRRVLDENPRAVPVRLQLAQVLQELGETGAALRELRAAQAGGLPPAVARLIDRYSQALRATQPVGGSLEIAIAPDNNINHATRSDTLGTVLGDFDIGKESKAKSGIGLAVRGQAFGRLGFGDSDHSLLVRLSGLADLYSKMRFNDLALDLSAGPEFRMGRNQINFELGGTQRWYGKKPFMRSARLGATWTRSIGMRTQSRLTGSVALVDNQFNDLQDGKSYAARIDVEHALSPTTGIGAHASLGRDALNDPGYSSRNWRLGLLGWHELGRATLTAEAELGRLNADERLQLFPAKRVDRFRRLSLAVTLRRLQYRGFAPLMRFTVERNHSTIEYYNYKRVRSDLGIVRAF